MVGWVLEIVRKLSALGKAVVVPLALGAIFAIPIGLWQLSSFQIESIGEGRVMMLTSFLVGLALAYVALKLVHVAKKIHMARQGQPNEDSPWNSDD